MKQAGIRRQRGITREGKNYNETDFNLPSKISYVRLSKQPKYFYPSVFNKLDKELKETEDSRTFEKIYKDRLMKEMIENRKK